MRLIRVIILITVFIFGCTVIFTAKIKIYVFDQLYYKKIIRFVKTPFDRPEITIIIQYLERKTFINDYRRFLFLIRNAIPLSATRIFKIIIYMDARNRIIQTRQFLIKSLIFRKFIERNATDIIIRYNIFTFKMDKIKIYAKFSKPDFKFRIIFSILFLGIGINIPNVERVMQYGALILNDPVNLW